MKHSRPPALRTSVAMRSQSCAAADPLDDRVRSLGDAPQPAIIAIEHGQAVGRQRFEQFSLGTRHSSWPAEAAQVRIANVRDHAQRRLGQRAQIGNLAAGAGTHLEHGVSIAILPAEHTERNAQMIVEIRRAGGAGEAGLQHGVDHLPRRCLSSATGDRDHAAREAAALPIGGAAQGPHAIVDSQYPAAGRWSHVGDVDNHARCSSIEGIGRERGAMLMFAAQGPEDVPRMNVAAIDSHMVEARWPARPGPRSPSGRQGYVAVHGGIIGSLHRLRWLLFRRWRGSIDRSGSTRRASAALLRDRRNTCVRRRESDSLRALCRR